MSQEEPTVPSSPWEAVQSSQAPSRQRRGPSAPPPQTDAPIAAPQAKIALPSPYEYVSELGRGGMGVVYLAEDPRNQTRVALKFLSATGQEAASLAKRFSREASQLAALRHPNIVGFLEAGYFQKQNYISMEYVEGGSLRSLLQDQDGPLTLQQSLELFAGVADGLEYIHNQGLIHRDLKPDNILLTPERVPKIGDFGLALKLEDQASRITKSGMILGTFSYLSPEQILSRDVGPSTDLYALGCCMYEAIAGRPLFSADTEFALLNCHLRQAPTPPSQIRPDLPTELDVLIMRLLAKQPGERPDSAAEVARMLRRLQQAQKQVWSLPVIGRDEVLTQLEQTLRPCLLRQSVGVLLTASSGQGRSRVVRQLIGQLQRASIAVHPIIPLPHQQEPAAELYRQLGGNLETWTQTLNQLGPEGAARLLWKQVEQLGSPRLLVIDDLLRQPSATNAVVEALCQHAPPPGFGWILSCAAHRANSLKCWEGALRVELGPLDDRALRDVAHLQLAGHLDDELSEGLLFRAAGSVRRLRLWILALRGASMLRRQGQLVTRDHQQAWPESLWEPLWMQLSARPEAEVKLLRVACMLDEPFPYHLVLSLSALDDAQGQAALDLLLRDGLLEECWCQSGDLFQFSSRELKEKLQASTPERLRRRVYSRIAQVLEGKAPTGVLAEYLSRAGNDAEALPKFLQAAFEAEQTGDSMQAERFWHSAVRLGGPDGPPEIRLMALAGRCENLLRLNRYHEIEECSREELSRPLPESAELKRSRRQLAGLSARARWQLEQRGPELLQFCRHELGQLVDSDFSDSLWLTWCWAAYLLDQGQPAQGLEVLSRLNDPTGYPAPYFSLKGALLRHQGQFAEADALLRGFLESSTPRTPLEEIELLLELSLLQVQLGGGADQQGRYLDQAAGRAHQLGDFHLLSEIEWQRGLMHEAQHDMGAALRSYQRVVEASRPNGNWLSQGYLQMGVALTKMERLDEAQRTLEEGLNAPPGDDYGQLYIALGVVFMVRGHYDEAREAFVAAEKHQVGGMARIMRSWCLWQTGENDVARSLLDSLENTDEPLERWLRQRLSRLQSNSGEAVSVPDETPWVLQGHPARGAVARLSGAKPPTPSQEIVSVAPEPPPARPQSRSGVNPILLGFAALTLVSLFGIALVLWQRRKPGGPPAPSPTSALQASASTTPAPTSAPASATPTAAPFVEPSPGRLVLAVAPARAEVRVNGRKLKISGGKVDQPVESGEVILEVRALGYKTEERELALGEGETLRQEIELEPLRGDLQVTTSPAPSRLFLDGLEIGRTQKGQSFVKKLIRPGKHQLKAVRDGYISQTKSVEIKVGEITRASFTLEPEPVYVPPAPAPAPYVPQPYYPPAPAPAPYYPPAPAPGPAAPDSF